MPFQMDTITSNAEVPKQRAWPRFVRKVGIFLYLLAFLVPPHWNFTDDFHIGGGFMAFIETPVWAFIGVSNSIQHNLWQGYLLGVSMMIGWVSNFSIFFRLPLIGSLFAIASPWVLFFGMTLWEQVTGFSMVAIVFIPFYPWATGIALIHISRLAEPKPKEERRTIWTGF